MCPPAFDGTRSLRVPGTRGIWSLATLGGDQVVLVAPKTSSASQGRSQDRASSPCLSCLNMAISVPALSIPLPLLLFLPHPRSWPHPSIPLTLILSLSLTLCLPLLCPFIPSFSLPLLLLSPVPAHASALAPPQPQCSPHYLPEDCWSPNLGLAPSGDPDGPSPGSWEWA